ncbi:MAG: spherulation-specific family 4 protein [Verrucomicrobiota bacterium]
MALLVPAYFGPRSGNWEQLSAAAARVPLVAIANLANGPGSEPAAEPAYAAAMQKVRAAGGQVIGYVYTQYGKRALESVEEDMRRWHALYSVDGFFVDEMSNATTAPTLAYYTALRRYARQLSAAYRIVGNPGTNTDEAYLTEPAADSLVIFENGAGYATFIPAAWTRRYPEWRFALLPYAIETADQMTNVIHQAASRRAGLIYVTDDGGNNPWDTLPSYWGAEIDWIESWNRDAASQITTQLRLAAQDGPILSLTAAGPLGRYVLESSSPLGDWRPVSTNLTYTGTSVWQVLNLPPNRFFRVRQN